MKVIIAFVLPLLAALSGCERPPAAAYQLVVTSQKWDSNSPVVYKLNTITGETWVNGLAQSQTEIWYKLGEISPDRLAEIARRERQASQQTNNHSSATGQKEQNNQ